MNDNTPSATRGVLALHGVRGDEALARFAGNEQRYRHWLIEFISAGPAFTAQIREAISQGEHEQAIKLSHSLKGRCGMLGMTELHSIIQTLEMTLRNQEPTTLWLEELERTAGEMSQQISTVLGTGSD